VEKETFESLSGKEKSHQLTSLPA